MASSRSRKLAEGVRPDDVALVRGEVFLRRPFAGEDVEVVEPEVDHHFVELAIAVGGAQEFLIGELGQHFALAALQLHFLGRARLAVAGRLGAACRAGGLLRLLPRALRRQVIVLGELPRALPQRIEAGEALRHRRVGDALGLQLLVDECRQPDLPDVFEIPRARSEADPVEDVKDRPIVGVGRDS